MERTITVDAVPQAKTRTMTNFRWKIAFLIFLISFVAYMDRVNLSVATLSLCRNLALIKWIWASSRLASSQAMR